MHTEEGRLTENCMDIDSPPGTRVAFSYPHNGSDGDRKKCQKYLEIGKTYTVDFTDVYNWHTNVFLKEVPGIAFNSVMFSPPENEE